MEMDDGLIYLLNLFTLFFFFKIPHVCDALICSANWY